MVERCLKSSLKCPSSDGNPAVDGRIWWSWVEKSKETLQLHAKLPRPFNEQRVIDTEAQREAYGIVI